MNELISVVDNQSDSSLMAAAIALVSRTESGRLPSEGAVMAVIIAWLKSFTELAISEMAAAPGLLRMRFEGGGDPAGSRRTRFEIGAATCQWTSMSNRKS
jgi:hypothetical protein